MLQGQKGGHTLVQAQQQLRFQQIKKRWIISNNNSNNGRVKSYTGYLRIKEGDRVAVWDRSGKLRQIDGPYNSFLFQQEIMPLTHFTASPSEYIRVEWKSGQVEHRHGPASLYEDPLLHDHVSVVPGLDLGPKCGLAVWKTGARDANEPALKLIYGPCTYLAHPDELLVQIVCHQANKSEYLQVKKLDGAIEHIPGPAELWFNPQIHDEILVQDCIEVAPGRALLVYDPDAKGDDKKGRRLLGPCVFFPQPFEKHLPIRAVTATDLQYLVIAYNTGRIEHRAGPCVEWEDPEVMKSISVAPVMTIVSHTAVVLYTLKEGRDFSEINNKLAKSDGQKYGVDKPPTGASVSLLEAQGLVTKRIVYGPQVLIPQPNEWIHTFVWHGTPKDARANGEIVGFKIPGGLTFQQLRLIADAFYFDVQGVRTIDDALLTMKFMVYFEMSDLDRMLSQTHDPIAELINALSSDAIEFASSRNFEQFKADTELLSTLESYKSIRERSQRIGFSISKIVYRGYHSSDKLQQMHDQAIEARTQLKLDAETEHQGLALEDLRLRRKQEREKVVQEIEVENMNHEVWKSQQTLNQELKERQAKHELELSQANQLNEEQIQYLAKLNNLGVNLTHFLTAKYQHPDKVLRIENASVPSSADQALNSLVRSPRVQVDLE